VTTAAELLFWLSILVLLWVYIGYPLAAWLVGRARPFRPQGGERWPRLVTVAIAAHDEAGTIEARIADILEQQTPFELEVVVGSDGSTDGTDELVRDHAGRDRRVRLLTLARSGQTEAQNRTIAAARGEIVVLTDAETRFAPGCLEAVVAPFRDERVGCVTGRIRWLDEQRSATARNEGLYWRYEQAVRTLESRAGWLTAVTGALLAVRREHFRPVPVHASMDHFLPLYIKEQGGVVLAEPRAVATDRGIAGLRQQFRNRARTATRGIQANLAMAGRLAPWRHPSAALAIWSHKLLRWATPWLLGMAALGALWAVALGREAYLVPLLLGVGLLIGALLGYLARRRHAPAGWSSLPMTFVVVNLAFAVGWINLLRGHRIHAWRREEWQTQSQGR
jgi:cellulose synthase/poly-beta-1,6-N-acetylglucosamine synthase-like glycosyltransferase